MAPMWLLYAGTGSSFVSFLMVSFLFIVFLLLLSTMYVLKDGRAT